MECCFTSKWWFIMVWFCVYNDIFAKYYIPVKVMSCTKVGVVPTLFTIISTGPDRMAHSRHSGSEDWMNEEPMHRSLPQSLHCSVRPPQVSLRWGEMPYKRWWRFFFPQGQHSPDVHSRTHFWTPSFSIFLPIIMVILILHIQMECKRIWEGTELFFSPAEEQHNDRVLIVHSTPNHRRLATRLGRNSSHYHGLLLQPPEITLPISM